MGMLQPQYLPSWSWAGWEGEVEYDYLKYGCYRGVYERHNGVKSCKCEMSQTCILRYGTKEYTKVVGLWDPNVGFKLRSRSLSKSAEEDNNPMRPIVAKISRNTNWVSVLQFESNISLRNHEAFLPHRQL